MVEPLKQIGLGIGLTLDEFNRRALIALKGVSFGMNMNQAEAIVDSCRTRRQKGEALSDKQQQALYNIVRRFRGQITDQAVKDYAAPRAKGSD